MSYIKWCPVPASSAEMVLEEQYGTDLYVCPLCDDGDGYGKLYVNETEWMNEYTRETFSDCHPYSLCVEWAGCDPLEIKDWVRHRVYPHHCHGCDRSFCTFDPADEAACECQTCEGGGSFEETLLDLHDQERAHNPAHELYLKEREKWGGGLG